MSPAKKAPAKKAAPRKAAAKPIEIGSPTNDAADAFEGLTPFVVSVSLQGTSDLLFHRWSCDDVAAKGAAAKGSAAKKTDNIESYVYRVDENNPRSHVGVPGEYLRMSIINAARFRQDPRSPRKSAMDLYKAAVVPLTVVASLGKNTWDYEDRRRVMIQRNGITRTRPAFKAGWTATFEMMCNLPEYVAPADLLDVIGQAGRVVGLGDFRPTFGRFAVTNYKVL